MNGTIFGHHPAGSPKKWGRSLMFSLPVFALGAISAAAGTMVRPDCPADFCPVRMVQPASLFGVDERRTETEYAREHNLSLRQVENRYAASGAIICRGFGERRSTRSFLYASGQLTARRNIITTTAHTIIDRNAKLMGRLENCIFETRIDGRKVSSALTSDYIAGFTDSRDSHFAGFDWAVIRLKDELPVEPYQVNDDLTPLFGWLEVANVIKVANFNFDNWGKSRTRTKSIADCAVKPETVSWSTGVRGLRTDCDIAPGNSGGAVLSEASGKPKLIGIIVGTTASSFKKRKQFDLLNDYNIGALVEGEFLQAIRDMSSMMSVAEIQENLERLGYDPGPVDGVPGTRTRNAIRTFQKDNGLEETGTISLNLSLALGRAKEPDTAEAGPTKAFEAASDAFLGDLYQWRAASLIKSGASRPDWLNADPLSNDVAGPQSTWVSSTLRGCRNILACLQAYGAPGPALRAAYALEKSGLVGTYVSSFAEYGAVDLVSVGYPYNTGGTIEYALVNGQPEAVAMRDSDVLSSRINDSGYQELRRTYPRALIVLAPRLESYRLMPDGGSRFVFAYPVTTGCQTCAPVGQVLMAYDFSGEGKFLKLHPLAYAQADGELHRQVRRTFSVNELTDDTALVQRRLNGLGYEAGPVDGVSGRRTEQAIAYFQTDHGLPATGEIDQATVKLLASDDAARHVRRFETLLAQGGPGTDRFGLGLLSRFQQLPNHTHLQLATLMNNVAGQLQRTGGYDEALARLSQAERLAVPVRAAQPALYSALLWNQAAIHLAMGDRESADDALRRAREALPQDGASFTVAAEALSGLERTKAALAALRNHLTDIATDGTNAAIRLKSLSAADGTDAHIYTLQYSSAEPRKI